eukprot:7141357-Alexandrium_andersonii.AAC.1
MGPGARAVAAAVTLASCCPGSEASSQGVSVMPTNLLVAKTQPFQRAGGWWFWLRFTIVAV